MKEEFKSQRNGIIAIFEKAKKDLEALNISIKNQMGINTTRINNLKSENKELKSLKTKNSFSIRFFSLFFRV